MTADETTTYECTECGTRVDAADLEGESLECPRCGGVLQNIGVSRE